MQEEEYDLESVTARLKAMETRRRRWQDRKSTAPEKQQLAEGPITGEFDLAPADLSSGGSDDDEYQSNSTNSLPSDDDNAVDIPHQSQASKCPLGQGRARKLRVTDSLDLSMSVSMFDGPSHEEAEATRTRSTTRRLSRSKLPGPGPIKPLQKSSQQTVHDQVAPAVLPERKAVCKTSRIPKLVQQRRQLHAANAQHAAASVHTQGDVQAPQSMERNIAPPNKEQNKNSPLTADCLSVAEPPNQAAMLPRDVPELSHSTSITKARAASTAGRSVKNVPEETDFTTAEEQRLLQSLEKLDQRLINVSTPSTVVREGEQPSSQERSRSVCTANGEIDKEGLRAAAYGGGAHCKLRQPSSVAVRSSSAKRAELSSGVHKSRVRVGGALVHDASRNNSTDASGKHKIVVKKDLAHLLF